MRKFTIILVWLFVVANSYAQDVTTIAGILEVVGSTDGPALEATFNNPHGIAMDSEGNAYIVDRFGHKVRKYSQDGTVTTLAGSGLPGNNDGIGLEASFNEPWGICVGNDGNIYVADTRNNLIRRITPSGVVTTFAGTGAFGSSNGPGNSASFGNPTGIEMDAEGDLYIADHLTHVIRRITPSGYVTTLAGAADLPGHSDGDGTNAQFNRPYGLTIDNNGDILVADEWNHRIRRITVDGEVTTIAGSGNVGHVNGFPDVAEFNYPWDLTVDTEGVIFVADGYNQVIRKMTPTGSIPESYQTTTYAGHPGETGGVDGFGLNAEFNAATGIHYWPLTGELYIADAYNNLIRKIINVDRPPVVLSLSPINLTGNPLEDVYCYGNDFQLQVTPDLYDTYAFYINDLVIQDGPATELITNDIPLGEVEVTVVATDEIGSVVSNSVFFTVEQLQIDSLSADQLLLWEGNDEVDFSAYISTSSEVIYNWDFGDPGSGFLNYSDEANPTHGFSSPGTYTIGLVAENLNGCRDTLVIPDWIDYREGKPGDAIFIPNAFTPNGDGNNDILYVRGETITDIEFSIFNQWGQLVFQSNNLSEGWDGNYKGKPASNCTYTYVVKAQLTNGDYELLTGHVSIIR